SERAEIGLVPAIDAEGTPALYARVTVGNHEIDIPIGTGGDVGLCGTNLTLDRSEAGTPCPALRVDDGMCDAVHVYWDEASGRYLATRLN
ncbi:MAG: hypothetical protein KDJ16_10650, partial [Hyphomicrobiales bacterium]|nr:hypothetical protein [Hyphomicrobiales bacterium]